MTPKEKAEYLVKIIIGKYYDWNSEYAENKSFQEVREQIRGNEWFIVKDLALFLVDEILNLHKKLPLEILEFYAQVKHEIENL